MQKKIVLYGTIVILLAIVLFPAVNAQVFSPYNKARVVGAGTFIHNHDDQPHDHYFALTVLNSQSKTDGWLAKPDGKLYLVAKMGNEVHMIVVSREITSFEVSQKEGGLSAFIEGTALVKHKETDWEEGWTFSVKAVDKGEKGVGEDTIHIKLTSKDLMEHHMEGTLKSGNIVINN